MSIVWSPEAVEDVEAAIEYLIARNPQAAERLAGGIVVLIERLAEGGLDGPEHVLKNGERVRGWPYPPFRVFYQRKVGDLLVVRVYHQRREPIVP